jgi:hypothetical protein
MRVGTASDAAISAIIWFPILALIAFVIWTMSAGVMELEKITPGTEFFVKNSETDNRIAPLGGGTYEEQLVAAMDSQDPEQMQAALDRIEAQQQALASRSLTAQ